MGQPLIQLVGPNHSLQIDGVKLLGFDLNNGRKLLLTAIFFLFLYLLGKLLRFIAQKVGQAVNAPRFGPARASTWSCFCWESSDFSPSGSIIRRAWRPAWGWLVQAWHSRYRRL